MTTPEPTQPAREPEKKPFYKKWWFIVIAVLVVLLVLAQLVGGGKKGSDEGESSATQSGQSESQSAEQKGSGGEAKEAEKEASVYGVGEEVVVGDLVFTVNSKTVTKAVGENEYAKKEANGQYVVVNVTVKNNGSKPVDLSSSFFKIKTDSAEYETDLEALTALTVDKQALSYEKVNPGNSTTGSIAFDMPEDVASSSDLELQVQTGVFGTEKELIKLG